MSDPDLTNLVDEMMATDHFFFACIYSLIIDAMDHQGDKEREWVDKYLSRVSRLIDAHEQRIVGVDDFFNVKMHELARRRLDYLSQLLRSQNSSK